MILNTKNKFLKRVSIIIFIVAIIFPLFGKGSSAVETNIPPNNPAVVWSGWQENARISPNCVGTLVRTDKNKYSVTLDDVSIRTSVPGDVNRKVNSATARFSFQVQVSTDKKMNITGVENLRIIENGAEVFVPSEKYQFTPATDLKGIGVSIDIFDYYSDPIANDDRKITVKADVTVDSEDEVSKTSKLEYGVGETFSQPQLIKAYYYDINTGEELSPKDIYGKNGFFDQEENVEMKAIPGYDYQGWTYETHNNTASASGTNNGPGALQMSSAKQAVTFWYSKLVPAEAVTVKYVDEDGNELAAPDTLTGNINSSYETKAKDISGWELKTTPSNATGVFTAEPQTVTYVYQKNVAKMSTVTVKYVDESGQELAELNVLTGPTDSSYTTKAKDISGWELKTTPSNSIGVYTDEPQTVIYVYNNKQTSRGKSTPVPPGKQKSPKNPFNKISIPKKPKDTQPSNTSEPHLPATGDEHGVEVYIGSMGVILLGIASFMLYRQRKIKNKL